MLALATILMIGATEGAWSVGALDLLSFSLVALILTGQAMPGGERAADVRRQTWTFVQGRGCRACLGCRSKGSAPARGRRPGR